MTQMPLGVSAKLLVHTTSVQYTHSRHACRTSKSVGEGIPAGYWPISPDCGTVEATGRAQTKERILVATADCIEKVGLEGLTSRKIAAQAEVPLAAINYHFGSKSNLVEQALLLTQEDSVKAIQRMLHNGDGTALARIEDFLHFVIASTQKFPTIVRAHLEGPLWRGESKSEYMRAFCEALAEFVSQLPPRRARHQRPATSPSNRLCARRCDYLWPLSRSLLSPDR